MTMTSSPSSRSNLLRHGVAAAVLSLMAVPWVQAAPTVTKDIVIDRVVNASPNMGTSTTQNDAMVLSVLIESPDGTLVPRSTNQNFKSDDRFRVKVIASRTGKFSVYNTTPNGELKPEPVWQGQVIAGQETLTPRLKLSNEGGGVDLLHFVLEPSAPEQSSGFTWLNNWITARKSTNGASEKDKGAAKDVRVDVQNTSNATYSYNPNGQGLINTVRIAH